MNRPHLRLVQETEYDILDRLLTEWEAVQRQRPYAERTIEDRIEVIGRVPDALNLTPRVISQYLSNPKWSAGTRVNYHSAIRAWSRYLVEAGHREDDPTAAAKPPKARKYKPRPLSDEHVNQLLFEPMTTDVRDMVYLALFAGLRVSEIADMRGELVDRVSMEFRVTGKGSKTRDIPIAPDLWEVAQRRPRKGWWFPSKQGNKRGPAGTVPILGRSVSKIIGNLIRAAGMTHTPHCLRHTFATRLVQSGVDIRIVQVLMGHEGLNTTALYTQVGVLQCREAIEMMPRAPACPSPVPASEWTQLELW